jgi:hypothetical protein
MLGETGDLRGRQAPVAGDDDVFVPLGSQEGCAPLHGDGLNLEPVPQPAKAARPDAGDVVVVAEGPAGESGAVGGIMAERAGPEAQSDQAGDQWTTCARRWSGSIPSAGCWAVTVDVLRPQVAAEVGLPSRAAPVVPGGSPARCDAKASSWPAVRSSGRWPSRARSVIRPAPPHDRPGAVGTPAAGSGRPRLHGFTARRAVGGGRDVGPSAPEVGLGRGCTRRPAGTRGRRCPAVPEHVRHRSCRSVSAYLRL